MKRRFKRGRATRDFMQLCLILTGLVLLMLLVIFWKYISIIIGSVMLVFCFAMLIKEILR